METKEYDISIKIVTEGKEPCHAGHNVGEEWILKGKTPEGLCSTAYNALYPMAWALQYGATFPWQEDPDVMRISCPDPSVNLVFELRRIPRD